MVTEFQDLDSPEKLKEYLNGQPKELGQIVASRCALRVLPVLQFPFDSNNKKSRLILAQTFMRAGIISWVTSTWPALDMIESASAVHMAAEKIVLSTFSSSNVGSDAALFSTSLTAFSISADHVLAVSAAEKAIFSVFGSSAAFWKALQEDFINFMHTGMSNTMGAPLWHEGVPVEIQKNWDSLKSILLAQDANWKVWTDWYEHILYGAKSPKHGIAALSADKLTELAQKPKEFWEREPDAVNAEIAGWLPKKPSLTMAQFIVITLEKENRTLAISEFVSAFENAGYNSSEDSIRGRLNELTDEGKIERVGRGKYALPDIEVISLEEISEPEPQSTSAVIFVDGGDDPINVDFDASASELLSDKSASDRHSEVLRLSDRMIDSYAPAERGANTAAILIDDVRHFRDALGEVVQDANPDFLIPRGEGLRQFSLANERRDDFSDLPELSDKYTLGLKSVISAYNVYISLDPVLASRDEARLGPDAVKTLISPEDGQAIIARAIEEGVASNDVGSVLTEETKILPVEPDSGNRNSRRYSESIKNFARVVLAKGLAYGKLVWRNKIKATSLAGGSILSAKWAIANEGWLLKTFAENPAMIETITQIISFLKTLPLA